jgi:DNA-binding response OmpR family regulator
MPKILIIDDDCDLRQALRVRLEKEHFQVITAESGTAGLEAAQADSPNLIVLDVSMPDMDGFQVLEQLRNNIVTWDLPVVVLTAQGDSVSRLAEPRLGLTRFMRKPLSPRHLVSEISRLLGRAST